MLVCLILSQRSLRLFSVLFILLTLFCSSEVISTILSSSLLIHYCASDILLLIPSRMFLTSVIVLFVSVWLFFNSSRSLLIDYCIFSISFSRFLIIFTIIILKLFSGRLPISSSFIWTSVFLVCSFICVVFLCLFIIFLTYCVWGLLFPDFKVELFLPSGFCPSKVGPVVCVRFVRFLPSFCLVVCFSSDEGWVRWWSCLLMIWFVFLFCLLLR